MRDLPNLDLMRSLAVLMVVASHLLLYTGHLNTAHYSFWFLGLLGVFLFFIHTTLVLMWSLDRDPHVLRFYIRRVFRIYPLWLVVLALTLLLKLPTSPVYAPSFKFYHASWLELMENVTLTFNLNKGTKLIGASWSLPVEVQMYIVLPFLYFFMKVNRVLWPLLLLEALLLATSGHTEPPLSQTLLFCAGIFLPGAMAYIQYETVKPRLPAWAFPVWICFLVLTVNTWAVHWKSSFRSGWLFALLVGLTLPLFRQIRWQPLTNAAHLVARYSYGVYLTHFAAHCRGSSLPCRVCVAGAHRRLPGYCYWTFGDVLPRRREANDQSGFTDCEAL